MLLATNRIAGCMCFSVAAMLAASVVVAADPIDYEKQIRPILHEHCVACHGPLAQNAGLRLDAMQLIRQGGDSGKVLEPEQAKASSIIERVTAADVDTRMPPEDAGTPLSQEKIALLTAWIDQGASGPEEEPLLDPHDHWAYQRLGQVEVPSVEGSDQESNPIDLFLDAARTKAGLTARPRASKETLLRRAHLDLIGLPPTREELHAFLANSSPDAYDKLIVSLLASPHYSERWARQWMDIWRYTDWFGLGGEVRYSQKHIWHWRDWIVDSLREDKGYDRMIVEMLAGDEIAPADPDTLRATGFLTRNWYLFNRNYWLDDVVGHSSRALLGMTFNCARCHDHKYDPIAQHDYYQLRAFFEPHRVRLDPIGGNVDVNVDGLSRTYDAELETPTYLFIRGEEKQPDKEHPLQPGVPAVFGDQELQIAAIELPLDAYYPGFSAAARERVVAVAQAEIKTAREAYAQAEQRLAEARHQRETLATATSSPEPATAANVTPTPDSTSQNLFVADDFSKPRPDIWEMVAGDWQYQDRLIQKSVELRQSRLMTQKNHPRDFLATMRFKILEGGTRSVGMIFDVTGDFLTGVYISPSGSKSQLYHIIDGQESYPPEARHDLEVVNGKEYELKVAVRDGQVNVWVNNELQFACALGPQRREGKFALTVYDAATEFLGVTIAALPADVELATNVPAPATQTTDQAQRIEASDRVAKAELETNLAQKRLAFVAANLPAIQARLAAETARYVTKSDSHAELAVAASQAERQAKFLEAEANVVAARQVLYEAQRLAGIESEEAKKPERQAAIDAARQKLEQAEQQVETNRKSLESPSSEYSSFGPVYPATSSGRRLALARWIANRDNPLTARVAVNHIWARHFGEPLVGSMFDFGLRTPRPLHHELLDWLAVEFMDSGWSMKHLHHLIMTSQAYQMESATSTDDPNLAKDPDNLYLWRMNPRRMEAEVIRDSLLSVSGQLNPELGGPDQPVDTAEKTRRRSIYYRYARHDQIAFLTMFDAPSVEECYRRPSSIVPQQALAMLNSKLSLTCGQHLAQLITSEVGADDTPQVTSAFIVSAFERVLGRSPTPTEIDICAENLKELAEAAAAEATDGSPVLRARENLVHVLLNHNEFMTLR